MWLMLYTTMQMGKRRLTLFVLVFGVLCAAALRMPSVGATTTEGINLQISPLPIELNVQPGSSTTTDLRVRNAGSQPDRLQLRLLKVTEDDNGVVHLERPGPTDDWTQWVSFGQTVFDAPAGQWQTIPMTVNVPKSAAFGYYFA